MQVQIFDLKEEAKIHKFQQFGERVPFPGQIDHQRAIILVGTVFDVKPGDFDMTVVISGQMQKAGQGIIDTFRIGCEGADGVTGIQYIAAGCQGRIPDQHNAARFPEEGHPVQGLIHPGKKVAAGKERFFFGENTGVHQADFFGYFVIFGAWDHFRIHDNRSLLMRL